MTKAEMVKAVAEAAGLLSRQRIVRGGTIQGSTSIREPHRWHHQSVYGRNQMREWRRGDGYPEDPNEEGTKTEKGGEGKGARRCGQM